MSTAVILLMLAAVLIMNFMINKQRMRQEIKEQQMSLSYQKELRNLESEIRESVMQHISRELHDDVQHNLTHLRFQVEELKRKTGNHRAELDAVEDMIFETTDQVRNLSSRLSTDFIYENEFCTLFQLEFEKLNRLKQFNVQWECDNEEPAIDREKSLIIYRIFQEMINNVLKHSRAKNIMVSLRGTFPMLIKVEDDGVGFDMLQNQTESNGLINMNKRAKMAGMHFEVSSSPGNGCRYILVQELQSDEKA